MYQVGDQPRLYYDARSTNYKEKIRSVRKNLTGAQDSHLQTVTIPEVAYIQLRRRTPEDEQGNARNM
jgi:hypothetical protein